LERHLMQQYQKFSEIIHRKCEKETFLLYL
jgi:hypothetical protein